jgi:HAD superfamily hydrolase (TIGR01509 family)
MRAHAVIFDMDGLMLDTEPLYKRAWERACGDLGFVLSDETFRGCTGRSDAEAMALFRRTFGGGFPIDRFRALWQEFWLEDVRTNGISTKAGIPRLLAALRARRVPRAVATSSPAPRVELALRMGRVAGDFSIVVTCEDVVRAKPAPDLFLEAARRLQLPATSCIVLEDSDAGAQAAVAAGMRVIVIPDLHEPSPNTRAIATAIHATADAALPTLMRILGTEPFSTDWAV